MTLATKERIISRRQVSSERYIRSTLPVFYVDLSKNDGTQFTSDDGRGHLCTVTGTTWTPQGRTFAAGGAGGRIALANNAAFVITGGSIIAWIKQTSSATQNRWIADIRPADESTGWFYLPSNSNNLASSQGTHYVDDVQTSTVPDGSWACVAVLGINLGNGGSARIGSRLTNDSNMSGVMGEVLIYNPALTRFDYRQIYLATKWRYK